MRLSYQHEVLVIVLLLIILPTLIAVIFNYNKKKDKREPLEENRTKKIRDHQLNFGRQVYNIITGWKEMFPLMLVNKVEDNGYRFSIFVGKQIGSGTEVILQLDFDLLHKFGKDCEGHIFYAPYGATMYFNVSSDIDARKQMWLRDLIWNRLEREFQAEAPKTI